MKISTRTLIVLCVVGALGCAKRSAVVSDPSLNNSPLASPPAQGIDAVAASPEQCPAGGSVYSVYLDLNHNGMRDVEDTVLSSQTVCNGNDGHNGYSTLFSLNRVEMGLVLCASGSGVQINSGLDADRSDALEASEISQVQLVCDGATGLTGAPGANGHGVVFETVVAPVEVCVAGGTTLMLALDVHDDGIYSSSLPNQQSMTLCNGQNAPVTAYTPVEPIMACGNSVAYKEVLLRLQNGQVLGSFSNNAAGDMTRLAFLPDGSFMNTDNSGCTFSLATSGDGLTRSISWFNQVQLTWNMP